MYISIDVSVVIGDRYCQANPGSIVAHPGNCAQYYNCSQKNTKLGGYLMECPYPNLFSKITNSCQNFNSTVCQNRFEPQAPCKFVLILNTLTPKSFFIVSFRSDSFCVAFLPYFLYNDYFGFMLYSVCILHSDLIHNNIGIHVNVVELDL